MGCCCPKPGQVDAPRVALRDAQSASRRGDVGVSFEDADEVHVPAGNYRVGADDGGRYPADGEGPARDVWLHAFRIARCTVTVSEFATFVQATGYATTAERLGWSFVFYAQVHPHAAGCVRRGDAVALAPWWLPVEGACWRQPDGPGSDVSERLDHPVVHVSWVDACAYADWACKRLPTEAEWEAAARGGRVGTLYPWGDTLDGGPHCNVWQGRFPSENTGEDGFLATAPVRAYAPNGYGLYHAVGNVWQWCADGWSANWHVAATPATRVDPRGPLGVDARVIRGGSYLCHPDTCHRFRLSARSFSAPDASTSHTGFRCATDA